MKTTYETLVELVQARKGYKYLTKNKTSPYQNFKYDFRKKIYRTERLDQNINMECGKGFNLATLDWILSDCSFLLDAIIVEFCIPPEGKIIVPRNSTGKFRTDIIKYKKTHKPEDLFPQLKGLKKKLKGYKPINPIVATKLPPKGELRKILERIKDFVEDSVWGSVGAPLWASVGASLRASLRASVGASMRASVWDSVGDSVEASLWASVEDSMWASMKDSMRASMRDSVRAQIYIMSYFAVKEFLNLEYEHPVFDLIRMGVIVVEVNNKFMVFGKEGKYLGNV